jgi:uncharacterized NAD(P)/FAD-binding protein YdhS
VKMCNWRQIAIVGAGFSGTATAIQLLRRHGDKPLQITLVNRHPDLGRGVAYGTHSPTHLLNVPAGRMSLFPDDGGDFLCHAQAADHSITGADFVPRSLYGSYLGTRLKEAIAAAPQAKLQSLTGEVVDLRLTAGGHRTLLELADGAYIEADRVVLTTGNYSPADPSVPDKAFFDSSLYIRDPWAPGAFDGVRMELPVLLIGTGLTMIDVALELKRRGFADQLFALSRRGLLPQAHRHHTGMPLAPKVVGDMLRNGPAKVRRYLRVLRLCVEELPGTDWRDIIGGLRPITAELWQALDIKERRRFLRHLQPYWDTHRHRMAPSASLQLAALLGACRLVMTSGRLVRLESKDGQNVQVTWRARGTSANAEFEVGTVINCTGPQTQLAHISDRLMQSLLRQGLIRPDALGLGIETDASDALVDRVGGSSEVIYYTGPLLRARYWECTAVPELRVAASRLAERLVVSLGLALPEGEPEQTQA